MDSFDEDKDKRRSRKNPFDFLNDKEFEQIFEEIQRMFESTSFQELIEKMLRNNNSNKHFIHTLSINIVPRGKPKIQGFSNSPLKNPQGETMSSEENELLTDIIKGDKEVAVTVEIPDVEKEDIDLNATENALEIIVINPERKYHKLLNLPCSIKPKTAKATYKNGVLDVVIKRKKKRKTGAGYRPTI